MKLSFKRKIKNKLSNLLINIYSNNKSNPYNKGAALVITLLIISVLSALAFSSTRLATSELKQSTYLEDSELAYQAAESGIELGLLYFRYNKDIEVPKDLPNLNAKSKNVLRYCINNDELISTNLENPEDTSTLDPAQSCFDLKVYRKNTTNIEEVKSKGCTKENFDKGMCVEDTANRCFDTRYTDTSKNPCYFYDSKYYLIPAIKQEEVVEYNVEGINNINLSWEFVRNNIPINERENFRLLFMPLNDKGEVVDETGSKYKQLLIYDLLCRTSLGCSRDFSNKNIKKIRIKPYGGDLLWYKITANPSTAFTDSRITTIESTGYYGNTKRKLQVIINRATGTLLPMYDYTIFTGKIN